MRKFVIALCILPNNIIWTRPLRYIMWTISLLYNCMVRSPSCAFHPWLTAILVGGNVVGQRSRVFSFGPALCFLSVHLSCFSRVLWAVAACLRLRTCHAPTPIRQTPRDSLSRSQLSTAHIRSTGSCVNARVFSCDYSFDKQVNKMFFGVKIRFRVFFYSRLMICCCGRRHWTLPEVVEVQHRVKGVSTPCWR